MSKNEFDEHNFEEQTNNIDDTKNPYYLYDNTESLEEFKERDQILDEITVCENLYESEENNQRREAVLKELESIVKKWVAEESYGSDSNINDKKVDGSARIFTFGSYKLGVHSPGSDIDTLCVAPMNISRHLFFESLLNILRNTKGITEINPIQDAHVPIIKMKFNEVEIDLLYARWPVRVVDDDNCNLDDDEMLFDMSKECILSINGKRNTDKILSIIPNTETFKKVLKLVKFWAKRRGIYGAIFGFLGGVSWTILVARICLFYPNKRVSELFYLFMKVYSEWLWPLPVVLTKIQECPQEWESKNLTPWNPRTNHYDFQHVMPIITPAFPAMNSSLSVHNNHKKILSDEFTRAYEIMSRMRYDSSKLDLRTYYEEIFDNFNFIKEKKYTYFLKVEICAKTSDSFVKWEGQVTSKIRKYLFEAIYDLINYHEVRPLPTIYTSTNEEYSYSNSYIIGFDFKIGFENDSSNYSENKLTVNLYPPLDFFVNKLEEFALYNREQMNLVVKLINKQTLETELKEGKLIPNKYIKRYEENNTLHN